MSKIGKKTIEIPQGVTIADDDGVFTVSGPKGITHVSIHSDIQYAISGNQITFNVKRPTKRTMALWGTMRALCANAIEGATKGFEKKLELEGMGYTVKMEGDTLLFNIGFSHGVPFSLPEGIRATVEKNVITLKGISKELVGHTAARIKKLKPPEPYKGKGIRYQGEIIRKKAGKKASSAAG